MSVASPFRISGEDLKTVKSSGNIKAVGAFLRKQGHQYVTIGCGRGSKSPSPKFPPGPHCCFDTCRYCGTHIGLPLEVQSTFTLHRDILHTVLLPVRLIRAQATHYARSTLSFHQPSYRRCLAIDLEVAFRGQARSAFSWIQCFTSQEQDWVLTRGCPACVVFETLNDESFIRILIAACRFSGSLQGLVQSQGVVATTLDPSIWLTAVRHAVIEDSFWGFQFWTKIEARAVNLELGMQELVSQCLLLSTYPPIAPNKSNGGVALSNSAQGVQSRVQVRKEIEVKQEEENCVKNVVGGCCSTFRTEAVRKRNLLGARRCRG
jgi:hypothetical protein